MIFLLQEDKKFMNHGKLENILPDFCIGRLKSVNIARIMVSIFVGMVNILLLHYCVMDGKKFRVWYMNVKI